MSEIVITSLVGLACTIISSIVTWFLSRKKYHTEVDHDKIQNMEDSLSFYERLTESNNKTLTVLLEKSEQLATSNVNLLIEVQDLRVQVEILVKILQNEVGEECLSKYGIKINEDGTIDRT